MTSDQLKRPSYWTGKNPRWTMTDLRTAVTLQCRECNDVPKEWHEGNDCTGPSCPLYPFRPGSCNPTVLGITRATKLPKRGPGGFKKKGGSDGT